MLLMTCPKAKGMITFMVSLKKTSEMETPPSSPRNKAGFDAGVAQVIGIGINTSHRRTRPGVKKMPREFAKAVFTMEAASLPLLLMVMITALMIVVGRHMVMTRPSSRGLLRRSGSLCGFDARHRYHSNL